MKLNRLAITNFKNIPEAQLEFSPKVNCLLGNNGMGKSNLLRYAADPARRDVRNPARKL